MWYHVNKRHTSCIQYIHSLPDEVVSCPESVLGENCQYSLPLACITIHSLAYSLILLFIELLVCSRYFLCLPNNNCPLPPCGTAQSECWYLLWLHVAQLKPNWFKPVLISYSLQGTNFMKSVNPSTGQWRLTGSMLRCLGKAPLLIRVAQGRNRLW